MYKASEDYPRLKELLDSGGRIVCYVDYKIELSDGTQYICRDIAEARRFENPTQYSIGVRGHGYGSVYPDWFHNYSEDALYKLWAYDHVQFIDPDPNRNNVKLKLIEK